MNVRNCRSCGRIFNYVMGPIICPVCNEALEKKFQLVKEYIREHKDVKIHQVAEDCDVSTNQIQQWLREERLELVEGSAISLHCENCDAPIASGRFCEKCKQEVVSGFDSVLKSAQPAQKETKKIIKDKENPKMRFLERD